MTREEIESLLKYASPKTVKKLTKMLVEIDSKENNRTKNPN